MGAQAPRLCERHFILNLKQQQPDQIHVSLHSGSGVDPSWVSRGAGFSSSCSSARTLRTPIARSSS